MTMILMTRTAGVLLADNKLRYSFSEGSEPSRQSAFKTEKESKIAN